MKTQMLRFFLISLKKIFIVIQLQLSAFSPHPSKNYRETTMKGQMLSFKGSLKICQCCVCAYDQRDLKRDL